MADHGTIARPLRGVRPTHRLVARVISGPDAGACYESQTAEVVTVGTAPDNRLVLRDPTVSRYHLELSPGERGIAARDLDSLNGTRVAGCVIGRAVVPAGAELTCGDTVLRLEDAGRALLAVSTPAPVEGIVAESLAMREVVAEVRRLAPTKVSVLLQGETGVGKEVIARALHDLSERRGGPFEVVDCGALPATLVASELFGHERGAFTGADRRHAGAFERAAGGTLFLDEIGELPIAVQPALLGVLERREFRRVGGTQTIAADVRVVSATHRELREGVNDGSFRADLYYRLAVARVAIPPLRERLEDIAPLVEHFVQQQLGTNAQSPFGDRALRALREQRWSGNIRELRNVVERAIALGVPDEGAPAPSAESDEAPAALSTYRDARERAVLAFEREYLQTLNERFDGNASRAARYARMDRSYLLQLLRKHGLR